MNESDGMPTPAASPPAPRWPTPPDLLADVDVPQVLIGNGVSELISMVLQAMTNIGDEILIPAPDYPLWTAQTNLSSGRAVHYLCDEGNGWQPDLDDIRAKITPRTKAIVIINPNNPTGAVYSRELLQQLIDLARDHELIVLADEIYEKVIYSGQHVHAADLAGDDVLCFTFSGLSKAYRACGWRAGWLVATGPLDVATNLLEGLHLLANMRMCANVPAQHAIQTALGGYQSIDDLVKPGAASTTSSSWRTSCSTRSRASAVSPPRARCTCSPTQ